MPTFDIDGELIPNTPGGESVELLTRFTIDENLEPCTLHTRAVEEAQITVARFTRSNYHSRWKLYEVGPTGRKEVPVP